MAFTTVQLTGTFETGGDPATGTLTFTLTQGMQNNGVLLPPSPVTVTLDANGQFAVELAANDDPATIPQGVGYQVTEQIVDAQPRDYFIHLSHTTSPVSLAALAPAERGWS